MSCSPACRRLVAGVSIVAGVLSAGAHACTGASNYEQHIIYANSPAPGPYYHSEASRIAPSSLEIAAGRLPTADGEGKSAPNCLRIAWTSAVGGDWRATIRDPGRDWRTFALQGDTLAFWCLADSEITAANSPRLFMQDSAGVGTPSVTLVRGDECIPAGTWFRVKIPFGAPDGLYRDTAEKRFSLRDAVSLTFTQGLDDGKPHRLLIDDIMVIPGASDDTIPPPAPATVSATAYERHIDVAWTPVIADDLLGYVIHRSLDRGKTWAPIATQRDAWTRYSDFLDGMGRAATYRVSSIDIHGNESVPSASSAESVTRAMTDDELLDMVQLGCFRYYWEAAHPIAGMAPEILPGDENLIALGGNGFGVMALLVAAERGFVTRAEAAQRMAQILRFLDKADRFHGAWPHFLDGDTGRAVAYFGKYDNGADIVETAFMIQSLLAARHFFDRETSMEKEIRETSTRLWHEVEWDWFRKTPDSDVLYWHWSPDHAFHINHPLIGWNETMIIYLLAIASPTHPVPASMYHTGWAGQSPTHVAYRQNWGRTTQGDHYTNGQSYYGIPLEVGVGNGAELFFTHFSFMGFDPRGIRDRYTNYFRNNRAIALIQHAYAIENPRGHLGYGADCWGRSAGVNSGGGRALPRDDNGTINCMASLASMPYTPEESLAALRHFYRVLGPKVWGTFGFHDSFNESWNWFDEDYMALNQAPIVVMIENHRSGLVWSRFMANPEIAPALKAIGFTADPDRRR